MGVLDQQQQAPLTSTCRVTTNPKLLEDLPDALTDALSTCDSLQAFAYLSDVGADDQSEADSSSFGDAVESCHDMDTRFKTLPECSLARNTQHVGEHYKTQNSDGRFKWLLMSKPNKYQRRNDAIDKRGNSRLLNSLNLEVQPPLSAGFDEHTIDAQPDSNADAGRAAFTLRYMEPFLVVAVGQTVRFPAIFHVPEATSPSQLPIRFVAHPPLPPGLELDSKTGEITGIPTEQGHADKEGCSCTTHAIMVLIEAIASEMPSLFLGELPLCETVLDIALVE
jgi:hypothetical protein